jgi:ribosomal protein L11 methyltransferase
MTQGVCYELRIVVPDLNKASLVELLTSIGEESFVEGVIDCDVDFEYGPEHLSKDYYGELAKDLPLILYSEDSLHLENVRKEIELNASRFGIPLENIIFTFGEIANQDWRESWKASFQPVDIDGVFVILPPWENKENFPHPHKIEINPGMAFGTGQHETTKLCLSLFHRLPLVQRVFDVGTGSGILALAARMYGCTDILGSDIDPESVDIAIENAQINHCTDIRFTTSVVHEILEKDFSLVFANIQSKPLRKIFPDIKERTARDGKIIVSGILATEYEDFKEYLSGIGIEVVQFEQQGDWVGFVCVIKQ